VRPLLITDCDEVLLHMVRHFRTWLDEAHGIDFALDSPDFGRAMTRRDGAAPPTTEEMWALLGGFFPAEMTRQTPVPGAVEALAALAGDADIVILTNVQDVCHAARVEQLARIGIAHRVVCNQGGKGEPVARLVAEHGDPVTVFVDDLGVHHESVARHAPRVHRLQLIAEPALAPAVSPAPHAHARIDDWTAAHRWIADRFAAGVPAAIPEGVDA